MFGFKNKKGVRAATATLFSTPKTPTSSHATSCNPFEKVVNIGKDICHSFSTTLGRKTSEEPSSIDQSNSPIRLPSNTPTATTLSHHTSEVCNNDPPSRSSSKSTAPTDHSLPYLEYGETFFVPGTLPDADKDKHCERANSNKEDSDDDGGPRCDFKTIEAVPDAKYRELIKACDLSSSPTTTVDVVRRTKGTYNAATFVTVSEGEQTRKYVVRVPGHGTLAHWQKEDTYVLKNEAQLIEYIRKNTTAPVAQVIHYSTGHDNALGFPYILMTMLPGTPANNIWFPEDYPSVDSHLIFQHADVPPPHIEKKRLTLLRSLAQVMIQIQTLKFDAIGAPNFDDDGNLTGIGPTCHWTHKDGDEAFKRPPAATTEDLILHRQPAFRGSPGETFTLHHNDLDLQNILCDDEGNVTGIIDWDNAIAAPRCIGATAVPMFLRSDWFPEYTFGLGIPPCMAWNYEHYREIYAAAIAEASDAENAEFTIKSGLYQAAVAAVTQGGDADNLISKLLREIPHCRVNYWEFIRGLGQGGWVSAQSLLETHLARIFEPAMPPEGLLEALDKELEIQTTWWSCCDELIDFYEVEKGVKGDEEDDG
ncbi:kinase-like domain-containing protein [Alternaria rosae]|uniref:kinase-like domain-containing protein n=1 Tax=Alternaria rosae TaxID=1187941 RepID=UPI001E8E30F1|nr:kinase-like domain-containing protein [Alternaria rosae]KAH6852936.1 kinase-like domain-containing protein [Alternaria rosae]